MPALNELILNAFDLETFCMVAKLVTLFA